EVPLSLEIARVLLGLVTLILSITVHEFAHAYAADRLGDDLPAREGRLTLNPIAHIDPIGTLPMPALAALLPGVAIFGWGRPARRIEDRGMDVRLPRRSHDRVDRAVRDPRCVRDPGSLWCPDREGRGHAVFSNDSDGLGHSRDALLTLPDAPRRGRFLATTGG